MFIVLPYRERTLQASSQLQTCGGGRQKGTESFDGVPFRYCSEGGKGRPEKDWDGEGDLFKSKRVCVSELDGDRAEE